MSDTYQAVHDAVRSALRNTDVGAAIREACHLDASFAIEQVKQEFLSAAAEMARPSAVYRPALHCLEGKYIATFGRKAEINMPAVRGEGNTPEAAIGGLRCEVVREMKAAFYFGCMNDDSRGHCFHGKGSFGWRLEIGDARPMSCPWSPGLADTGLLKNGKHPDVIDGKVWWTAGGKYNHWFAFFWWDRSGDSRPNSNSGLYVRGFNFDEREAAFAFACAEFPDIVTRQRVPLVLQP